MKIDLKQLKIQPQSIERFTIIELLPDTLFSGMGGRFLEPVRVDLKVSFTGQMYVGQGEVRTRLEFACSRCLTPHTFAIAEPLNLIMMDAGSQKPDDFKDDALPVEQGEVDIEPGIIAAIFSVIPFNPLCNPECQGLCSGCGVNKNKEACRCREDNIDPRWEALKKLNQEGGE
ncbi:MAG: YceD family protein [Syntrophomonadaceae bacterium]